jgi:hypothetical protein
MKLKEIIGKIMSGGQLVAEEKEFLESIPDVPPVDNNPQPADPALQELQSRLESIEQRDVPPEELARRNREKELEGLRDTIAKLSGEKDQASQELENLKFNSAIRDLAANSNFTDAEYLGFLLRQQNVDVANSENVTGFIDGLREASPGFFRADVAPGAGSMPNAANPGNSGGTAFQSARGNGSLAEMLKYAPTERLDA